MNILRKWTEISLVLRIFIGLVIGAILGLAVPGWSWMSLSTWLSVARKYSGGTSS